MFCKQDPHIFRTACNWPADPTIIRASIVFSFQLDLVQMFFLNYSKKRQRRDYWRRIDLPVLLLLLLLLLSAPGMSVWWFSVIASLQKEIVFYLINPDVYLHTIMRYIFFSVVTNRICLRILPLSTAGVTYFHFFPLLNQLYWKPFLFVL